MKSNTFKLLAWAAATAFAAASPAVHANIVTNGGFETGDFTGWTQAGFTDFTGVDSFLPHSGTYTAFFNTEEQTPGSSSSSIWQDLSTVAGATYLVEFWLRLDDSARPNSFSWSWGGASQDVLTDSAGFDYTHFSTLVTATGSTTRLQFNFMNDQSFWLFDDVAVNVPEPGGMLLAGTALLLLATTRRPRAARPV